MNRDEAMGVVTAALESFMELDSYLLQKNLNERCIASRLALHLQNLIYDYVVDAEYNRAGATPKRLKIPDHCADSHDDDGKALVVPDIIVHRRGAEGPNVMAIEVKKTSNREGFECDSLRVRAFCRELHYSHGVLIECRTGENGFGIGIREWVG